MGSHGNLLFLRWCADMESNHGRYAN